MHEAETRTAKLWVGEDNVLRARYGAGTCETLADAQANVAEAKKLAAGAMLPVLIDMSAMVSITKEARDYYSSAAPAAYSLAQALITASPLSRLIGNFFLGLNKPPMPVRLFTSESDALRWLEGFRK